MSVMFLILEKGRPARMGFYLLYIGVLPISQQSDYLGILSRRMSGSHLDGAI